MASFTCPRPYAYHTGGAIVKCRAVKLGADEQTIVQAGAGEVCIGIAMNNALQGQDCEAALPGGGFKMQLGATVPKGSKLAAAADGRGVVATGGAAVIAFTLADGVANDIVPVEIILA